MFAVSAARRDDGFSIAEVVIAAAILFFVLTAMVGLIGASQTMSVMAKDRTTLTNAMAQHIDHIRAMDYETIATPPSGSVPPSQATTIGPYTINFTNRVIMPDGANGKYLRTVYIKAICSIRGKTYKTSATVHIRNPKNDTTAASIADPEAPVLEFTSATTPENAVLYENKVHPSGSSIELAVKATSENDAITNVKYRIGTMETLRDGAGMLGDEADFPFSPGVAIANTDTYWDTRQSGVSDGLEKVSVQATDSMMRTATIDRQFVVDNVAPAPPGAISLQPINSSQSKLTFAAAADPPVASGQTPFTYAVSYPMTVRCSTTSGGARWMWPAISTDPVPAGTTYLDAMFNAGPFSTTVATSPFSRYYVRLVAQSPRGLTSTPSRLVFVSPPETHSSATRASTCSTEYVKSGSSNVTTYDVSVWITKPTFPVTSSATTYKFYTKPDVATAGWNEFVPTVGPVMTEVGDYWKLTFTCRRTLAAENLWFKVAANVTPSGETAAGFTVTNAIGVSAKDPNNKANTPVVATIYPDTTWAK
ncbi:MAG TPA: hypothetical protein VLA05_03190 [Coriobacteriia bacterium]|nr:hypothetical protein [Coriobacteriia bacterium]